MTIKTLILRHMYTRASDAQTLLTYAQTLVLLDQASLLDEPVNHAEVSDIDHKKANKAIKVAKLETLEAQDTAIKAIEENLVSQKPQQVDTYAAQRQLQDEYEGTKEMFDETIFSASPKKVVHVTNEGTTITEYPAEPEVDPITVAQKAVIVVIKARLKGKVKAGLRVKAVADSCAVSQTMVRYIVRELLSDQCQLMRGAKIPKAAIHSTGVVEGKPMYIVRNKLIETFAGNQ